MVRTVCVRTREACGYTLFAGVLDDEMDDIERKLAQVEIESANARAVAGVLASHPRSRDLKLIGVTITFYGRELVCDTSIDLNMGRRYGLVGLNGCGKSTLLQAIAHRELPIPSNVDTFLLSREMPATEKTAIKCVIDVDLERARLEREAEELACMTDDDGRLAVVV